MTKGKKIIYWVFTLWASLGLTSTALVQIFKLKANEEFITHLGYPDYFLTLIGVWKLLGVIAILIPKFPLLKEWAYAGLFFLMSGAIYSHIAMRDPFKDMFPSMLLSVIIAISWYFRPANRKIVVA